MFWFLCMNSIFGLMATSGGNFVSIAHLEIPLLIKMLMCQILIFPAVSYTHTHHTHIHIYMYMCVCVYMHACVCMYIYIYYKTIFCLWIRVTRWRVSAAAGCLCCQTGHHGHVHHPSAKHPHSRVAAAHLHRAGCASQRASGRCGWHRSGLPGHRPQAQRRGVAGRDRLVCVMAWNETSCSQLCSFMIELLSVVSIWVSNSCVLCFPKDVHLVLRWSTVQIESPTP